MTEIVQQVPQHPIMLESKQYPSFLSTVSSDKLKYIKGKTEKTFFYKLLKDKKRISCYKHANMTKVIKKVKLKGAKIITENPENATEFKLLLKTGRIVVFDNLKCDQKLEIEALIASETKKETGDKQKKSVLKNFKKGFLYVAKAPVKLSSGTIHVLEKISDGFKKTPGTIFKNPANKGKSKKKKEVKGAAQGLYLGAESIVTEVFGAIAGLVTEPVKGGKSNGLKGVGKGIGRGIVGLIFKPVAGSIDLVTKTARGVGTVPKTLYKGIFKIKQKGVKGGDLDSKDGDKTNFKLVFENEKGAVYVNKEVLTGDVPLVKGNGEKGPELTEIMVNIINNLDENSKNQHIELLSDNEPNIVIEEEANEGISDEDQEITKIINHYEENESAEEAEDILEILYVKNPTSANKAQTMRRASTWSMQTNSFGDLPQEKFVILKFDGPEKTEQDEDSSSEDESYETESYNSNYAVNKGIPIDDSDEFDVDEFKHDEIKLQMFLALHTGREGRNGPDNRASIESARLETANNVYLNNILELLGEEYIMNVEPDFIQPSKQSLQSAAQSPTGKGGNKFFEKKPSNIGRRSRASILVLRKNMDLNDMYQLLDDPEKLDLKLKNWVVPDVLPDLKYQELPDLNDLIKASDYEPAAKEYNKREGKELAKFLTEWKGYEDGEDVRFPHTHKKGGKVAENDIIIKKMRNIAKDFVKKIGRTVLSGNFNLASVPFPIKATYPKSYLENVGAAPSCYFPLYMNLAMRSKDPIERFKCYIVGTLCYFYLATPFAKPFNPIIGETYTGRYKDGGKVYLEQISHHPPVSYMLYYGPNESYRIWGPTMFSASAGMNSIKLITKGWRKIQFGDTQQIISNTFPNEAYDGIFWGTCVSETVGDMEFVDTENDIYCKISFGHVKKKASDYIEGVITVNGRPVSQVTGTCLGWIEIDGMRYFDYRYAHPFQFENEKPSLQSDFRYRQDYLYLKNGYLDQAQKYKDEYENLQRKDGKMRKEYKEQKEKQEKLDKKAKK